MANFEEYVRRVAADSETIINKLNEIQAELAGVADELAGVTVDVESNALAIEDLAEIIASQEVAE